MGLLADDHLVAASALLPHLSARHVEVKVLARAPLEDRWGAVWELAEKMRVEGRGADACCVWKTGMLAPSEGDRKSVV